MTKKEEAEERALIEETVSMPLSVLGASLPTFPEFQKYVEGLRLPVFNLPESTIARQLEGLRTQIYGSEIHKLAEQLKGLDALVFRPSKELEEGIAQAGAMFARRHHSVERGAADEADGEPAIERVESPEKETP